MDCSQVESRLTDHIEQAVDPRLTKALTEHIGSCQSCSRLISEVRLMRADLESFPQIEVSPGLIKRILTQTSGVAPARSLWRDHLEPTLRPFLSRRFAFGTGILLVFTFLSANLWVPMSTTIGFSSFAASGFTENADRISDNLRKSWAQIQVYENRVVQEFKLMQEDLYGRLDYYLISLLFRSYGESVEDQRDNPDRGQSAKTPDSSGR